MAERPVHLLQRPVIVAGMAFAVLVAVSLLGWRNVFGATAFRSFGDSFHLDIARDVGGGLTFGIAGLVIWNRRPWNLTGPLMLVIGAALVAWSLQWVPVPPLVTLGHLLLNLPTVLIGVLILVYPSGRVDSQVTVAWLLGALLYGVLSLAHVLVTPVGAWECAECHSWFVLSYDENLSNNIWLVKTNLLAILAMALIGMLVHRWIRATPPARQVMTPLWLAGVAFAAVALATITLDTSSYTAVFFSDMFSIGAFLRLRVVPVVWEVLPWIVTVSMFLIPLALLWGILRSHFGQVAVSQLAVQLRRADGREPLVVSLRRALGDRSLELALWSRPDGPYVTSDGLPVDLSRAGPHRTVTELAGDDGPLAAMVHDPAVAEQRQLIEGVAAVAQLALENERLHAEVKAQLEEVRASRQRIVRAADDERRRVERNIHDGAQQRLVSLSLAIGMARSGAADVAPEISATLGQAEAELRAAISDLRELARGIYPAILSEAGLGAALESLAEHSRVPVALDARFDGRVPPAVEATAYFIAAETLTNVVKHAGATAAKLRVTAGDGRLRMLVADNGTGGADPDGGSGIRGLMDRVAALGGTLLVSDDPDGGTRLEAEIPYLPALE